MLFLWSDWPIGMEQPMMELLPVGNEYSLLGELDYLQLFIWEWIFCGIYSDPAQKTQTSNLDSETRPSVWKKQKLAELLGRGLDWITSEWYSSNYWAGCRLYNVSQVPRFCDLSLICGWTLVMKMFESFVVLHYYHISTLTHIPLINPPNLLIHQCILFCYPLLICPNWNEYTCVLYLPRKKFCKTFFHFKHYANKSQSL